LDQAVLDRIVVDDAGHWLWQGWKDRNGYGQFWFKGRRLFAHRASWEAWSMDGLPKWAFVLHRCDIPACIRPDHLFLGTQADNIADAKAKGAAACIVCSPIPRNRWTDGKVGRNTGFNQWAEEAAKQAGASFINLNEIVAAKYDALGQEKVTATLFPENETVHPDWAGAVLNAECVIDALRSLDGCPLVPFLLAEAPKDLAPPSGRAR